MNSLQSRTLSQDCLVVSEKDMGKPLQNEYIVGKFPAQDIPNGGCRIARSNIKCDVQQKHVTFVRLLHVQLSLEISSKTFKWELSYRILNIEMRPATKICDF